MNQSRNNIEAAGVHLAIKNACEKRFGILDHSFLCQSIGVMNPPAPVCVTPDTDLGTVVRLFQERKIGSIVITDGDGKLIGIFTERDCVLRGLPEFEENSKRPISQFMTANPICQAPDITIAFALNLMSEGGFRHLPLVDLDNHPVGIVSTRNMMDFIVRTFVEELMNFEVDKTMSPL